MRQAGILAAAGIVALETIVPRMKDDHQHAKDLASGLASIPGIELNPSTPHTNMVYLTLGKEIQYDANEMSLKLKEKNVLVGIVGARSFRLVTHFWIDSPAVDLAVNAFKEILHP